MDEEGVDSTLNWRIAYEITQGEFNQYLDSTDRSKVSDLGDGNYLLPEVVWVRFENNVRTAGEVKLESRIHSRYNPDMTRRSYKQANAAAIP